MVELQVRKERLGGIEWKTPGTSLSFCRLMGCRASGIDQQVGKFDTRQRKSVREAEREKRREQGINDSQLSYSRLCLKYESL